MKGHIKTRVTASMCEFRPQSRCIISGRPENTRHRIFRYTMFCSCLRSTPYFVEFASVGEELKANRWNHCLLRQGRTQCRTLLASSRFSSLKQELDNAVTPTTNKNDEEIRHRKMRISFNSNLGAGFYQSSTVGMSKMPFFLT